MSLQDENQKLQAEIRDLKTEISQLRDQLDPRNQRQRRAAAVDRWCEDFLDRWWDTHHESIDVGKVRLPLGVEIDVIPDAVEKAIYAQVLKILASALHELTSVHPVDPS